MAPDHPPLLEALRSGRVLLMDGAMGTELQRRGLGPDENASSWLFLHPERVRQVHQAYLDAGARVHLSNTFLLYADTWIEALHRARVAPLVPAAWQSALELMGDAPCRVAALGPVTGALAGRELDDVRRLYVPARRSRREPQVPDAVLLETCSSPRVRYALRHLRRTHGRRLLLSLSYQRSSAGQLVTASGHSPEWFAERAETYGLAALGVNCGRDIGMDDILEIVRRYRRVTRLPLFARPNAGTPRRGKGRLLYPLTPARMAARLPELLEAGVSMVGGCCGTTPAHIAALARVVEKWNGG